METYWVLPPLAADVALGLRPRSDYAPPPSLPLPDAPPAVRPPPPRFRRRRPSGP